MVYEGPWSFPCAYVTISAFTADTFLNGSCLSHIIASPAPLPPFLYLLLLTQKQRLASALRQPEMKKPHLHRFPMQVLHPLNFKPYRAGSRELTSHINTGDGAERFFSSNGHQKYSHQFNQEATEVPNLVQIYSHEAGMLPSIANSIALYRLTAANYCCGGATSCTPSVLFSRKISQPNTALGLLLLFPVAPSSKDLLQNPARRGSCTPACRNTRK